MIKQLPRSSGNVLGFALSGDVSKDDYDQLIPAVTAALTEYGSIRLLCDMRNFRWEKVDAWRSDMAFGKQIKHNTVKMAVVGDNAFEHLLSKLAEPFYAQEVKYCTDIDDAWTWVAA